MQHKPYHRSRGIALMIVLMVTLILVIFTTALVALNLMNLSLTGRYRDRVAALKLAEAGITSAAFIFSHDPAYSQAYSSKGQTSGGYFEFTFNPLDPNRSVNNLTNEHQAGTKNFRGETVAPHSADMVIIAHANSVTRRVHVVFKPDLYNSNALTSLDKIYVSGNCKFRSISDGYPARIHSNYQTRVDDPESARYAIDWNPKTTRLNTPADPEDGIFDMDGSGVVSCIRGERDPSINPKILHPMQPNQFQGTVDEAAARVQVPNVDVPAIVDRAIEEMSEADEAPMTLVHGDPSDKGAYVQNAGILEIKNQSLYRKGNYTVIGDVVLDGGNLYIDGNLEIIGSISGTGTVFVKGETRILGGDARINTHADDGATIISHGNVEMHAFDTDAYMQRICLYYGEKFPNLHDAYQRVYDKMTRLDSLDQSNPDTMFKICNELAGGMDGSIVGQAPDGSPAYLENDRLIHKFLNELHKYTREQTNDKIAHRVESNFEEAAFKLRAGVHPNGTGELVWDCNGGTKNEETGEVIPYVNNPNQTSFTQQYWLAKKGRPGPNVQDPAEGLIGGDSFTMGMYLENVSDFFTGRSSPINSLPIEFDGNKFQGVVYTSKNLLVNRGFNVTGMVLVRGEVSLKAFNEQINQITYDDKYRKGFCRIANIYQAKSWEEF